MSGLPIFFAHLGVSGYMPVTMDLVRLTNPASPAVLIGDGANRALAAEHGWQHADVSELGGERLDAFRKVYRLLSTANHPDRTLPIDFTKFCFERYFHAAAAARRMGQTAFWMFDSDDLLLEDLAPVAGQLERRGIVCTRMAHNSALRGLMDRATVEAYCDRVIELFGTPAFVAEQDDHFASGRETLAAFTDMSAARHFVTEPERCAYFAHALEGWYFDDCIVHPDGCETTTLGHLAPLTVKHVHFDGREFWGRHEGRRVRFGTVNGSGLPRTVFAWFLDCAQAREQGRGRASDIRTYQPSLARELGYIAKSRARRLFAR